LKEKANVKKFQPNVTVDDAGEASVNTNCSINEKKLVVSYLLQIDVKFEG
jgi:hypothetical protein